MAKRPSNSIEFGYFPRPLKFKAGKIEVSTILPSPGHLPLPKKIRKIEENPDTKGGWYFYHLPPFPLAMNYPRFRREWMKSEAPKITNHEKYVEECWGKMELSVTHRLKHDISGGDPHLKLLVRLLGFFYGMNFGWPLKNNMGATPIRPHMLCDFYIDQRFYDNDQGSPVDINKVQQAMLWAESFVKNHNQSDATDRLFSIILRLFLSQKMTSTVLMESFDHIYNGLEACYGLMRVMMGKKIDRPPFHKKMRRLCKYYGCPRLERAEEISDLRNSLVHESIFDSDSEKADTRVKLMVDVIFEMQRLLSRLIIAFLIGSENAKKCAYVRSSLTDWKIHKLILPPLPSA